MNGEPALEKELFDDGREAGVIGGAERLRLVRGADGDGGVEAGIDGGTEQEAERGGVGAGHVAGEDEAPVGEAGAEGGIDAAQRAEAGEALVEAGEAEVAVEGGRADDPRLSGGFCGLRGDAGGEGRAAIIEQRLVRAHAAAAAAGEDEGSAGHERIVATEAEAAAGCKKRAIVFETCGCIMY